jgi:hypothetical protein
VSARLSGRPSIYEESGMTTHKQPAKAAGKLLAYRKTPKTVKKVAASDLAQAKKKGSSKKK